MKLLLATQNLHKILELKAILKEVFKKIDIYTLRDFKEYKEPEEVFETFEENAELKALTAAKFTGMLTLADDSGLVVPSLNGAPGIVSAHYAGIASSAKENREKLLFEMKDFTGDKRNAYYNCSLCLARSDKVIKTVSAICEGRILEEAKGANGFGYDPIFVKHDYNQTFAEIPEDIKIKISHRRRAFEKIKLTLDAEFQCTIS